MSFDECYIKSVMRTIPDWPEPGIMFRDITPLFKRSQSTANDQWDTFIQRYIDSDITHIASIDARGFLIGSIMAYQLNIPLVLVRKKGKLPGATISQEYKLEYGSATVEMQADAVTKGDNVLIFDDLIATGGTVLAASTIIAELGASVAEVATLINLPDLQGSRKIQEAGIPVFSLMSYEGL